MAKRYPEDIWRLLFNLDEWPQWNAQPENSIPVDGYYWSNLGRGGDWVLKRAVCKSCGAKW